MKNKILKKLDMLGVFFIRSLLELQHNTLETIGWIFVFTTGGKLQVIGVILIVISILLAIPAKK